MTGIVNTIRFTLILPVTQIGFFSYQRYIVIYRDIPCAQSRSTFDFTDIK